MACATAVAQEADQHVNFVSCPLLRDTTPNCWTALAGGETYFIGAQRGPSDSYLPQMKHQVLVEGVVTTEPRVCGGIVLRPLRVSVLPELDLACDSPVLPADGLTPPTLPARGGAAQALPSSDVLGPVGSFMRTPVPQPPFTDRQFRIEFDFGTDILTDQMQRRVIEILTYGATAKARAYVIRGYPAATLLTDGKVLREAAGLGEQRARKIADVFANLGAPRDRLRVEWASQPETPDGQDDAANRRVTVTIVL
jgi:outer membrane protein OmpA-like peptidoglycan-associated protein